MIAATLAAVGCGNSGATAAAGKGAATAAKVRYHCPMHPTYIKDGRGTCPICQMDLVVLEEGASTGTGGAARVSGRETVFIPPERRQQIGLVTASVEKKTLTVTLRVPASVQFDESRYFKISPRVGGWIQRVHAAGVGERVEKGRPLFTLYSPELLASSREYLQARAGGDEALRAAARRRLALFSVSEEQLAVLEQAGVPRDTLDVLSPVTGVIIAKSANEGQSFAAGDVLYEVADLSRVWLHALVPDYQAALVSTGQLATVSLPSRPNEEHVARVSLIYPVADETTRRVQIRLELDNPDRTLRPNLWADVELEVESGEGLAVPADAVIDTGTRRLVFVARDDGHFEPRVVKIGLKTDEAWQVTDGLAAGERVVTRALFLVDAESQLRAAISAMTP